LPCLEAFEMGIENPSIYFLFYEYFFKSSVGDARWRRACVEDQDQSAPLGSVQAEAFAMLQLKNNYFAWLLEAKENLSMLITDYDPDSKRAGMKSAAEVYLKKILLNLAEEEDDEDLLVAEGDAKYRSLKKATDELLVMARRSAKTNATYKEVKKIVDAWNAEKAGCGEEEGEESDTLDEDEKKRERQRKRRKVLKPFREYTVRQGEEGKFKGWSRRAACDMAAMCKKLKHENNICLRKFRTAYRKIYLSRNQDKRSNAKKDVEEETVDYNELWDLGEINCAEI
jgi:hypothetical protein